MFVYVYLRDSFALKPFHHYSLCLVCILPQPAFYSESAVCIVHLVCILPLVCSLQSAVCSLRFTLTGFFCWLKPMSFVYVNQLFPLSLPCSAKEIIFFIVLLDERKIARTFSNDKGVSNFNFPRMENYIMVKQSGQWLNELNS